MKKRERNGMGTFSLRVIYKPHQSIPTYQFYLALSKNNFLFKEQNRRNLNIIIYDITEFFGCFISVIGLTFRDIKISEGRIIEHGKSIS